MVLSSFQKGRKLRRTTNERDDSIGPVNLNVRVYRVFIKFLYSFNFNKLLSKSFFEAAANTAVFLHPQDMLLLHC